MAVEAYIPLSKADGFERRPIDEHGKLRFVYTKTVIAVTGDINSTFDFGRLPMGTVRVLYPFSFMRTSATVFGASRVLAVGLGAYKAREDQATYGDGYVAAVTNELASGLDLSVNARLALSATLLKYDLYSKAGIPITGLITGGTAPAGAALESLIAYLYE